MQLNYFTIFSHQVFGEGKEAAERTCKLLEALLNTLTKVFKHDSVGFVTPERFELLSAPLTDLVGICVYFYSDLLRINSRLLYPLLN